MESVRTLIRRHRWLYHALRRGAMALKRWRYGLKRVHPTCFIAGKSTISSDLVAGEFAFIGPDCTIGPGVRIGPYSMLASRVAIVGGDHRFDFPGVPMIFSGRPDLRPTIIEADVWIGYGAIILAGVSIGRGSIVAAGALVTRDVAPYEIHGGVRARKIGERFAELADRMRHDEMLSQPPKMGEECGPKTLSLAFDERDQGAKPLPIPSASDRQEPETEHSP